MWTTPNGCSRALASVATAGVVALTVGGVTATPVAAHPGALPVATVSVPVGLTALTDDSSLMDIIGELTGLSFIMQILDDPNSPLFPFAIMLEAVGEIFVLMPLLLVVGAPLLLITEGPAGLQEVYNDLGSLSDNVATLFDGLKDWYATHNPFTGALLDATPSDTVDPTGLGDATVFGDPTTFGDPGAFGDPTAFVDPGAGDFGAGDFVFTMDGIDTVLTDLGLEDLIA
jgi:hypothetical protein